MLTQALV